MKSAAALAGAALLFASCASTPPALQASDGSSIRSADPAPYRIAVAPVEVEAGVESGASADGDKWYLSTANPHELREMLVASLRDLDAVSEVAMLEDEPDAPNLYQTFDLVLVPKLKRADFEYTGASDRIWISTAAWLFSWIGALWIGDAEYDSSLVLECEVFDPYTQRRVGQPVAFDPGAQRLTFWDRNEAWTTGFFMTIVWPPFWARDKGEVVSRSLTEGAMHQVAGSVKRYLIEEHGAQVPDDRFAEVTFRSPRNGARVRGNLDLVCNVKTRQPVIEAAVFKDGVPLQAGGDIVVSELPGPEAQASQVGYEFDMTASGIPMNPGPNMIRLLLILEGGRRTSRSIVFNG